MATQGRGAGRIIESVERESLERDYRAHARWLTRIARARIGAAEGAEDLVQESFIRAAHYSGAERVRVRPLLARILGNLILDRAKSRVRERAGLARLAPSAQAASVERADQHELLVLKQVVLGMPPMLRDVFLLSRFTALSQVEIAARLGISVKTVEWRLATAVAYCVQRMAE